MNAGRTVIVSTDVGCQPDLIEDGVTGFVFPTRNVDALTVALRRALASPQISSDIGARAQKHIRSWGFEQDVRGLRKALAEVTGKLKV